MGGFLQKQLVVISFFRIFRLPLIQKSNLSATIRYGPPEVMQRIADGEEVDPSEYYLRDTPNFETASEKYDWLNRIVAVGGGRRLSDHAAYEVFQIL